jgi:hypothetical protein
MLVWTTIATMFANSYNYRIGSLAPSLNIPKALGTEITNRTNIKCLLAYNRSPPRFAPSQADLRCRSQSRPYRLDPETRVASIHAHFNLPTGKVGTRSAACPANLSERPEKPPTPSATFRFSNGPDFVDLGTFSTKSTGDIPSPPLEWPSPAWAGRKVPISH